MIAVAKFIGILVISIIVWAVAVLLATALGADKHWAWHCGGAVQMFSICVLNNLDD